MNQETDSGTSVNEKRAEIMARRSRIIDELAKVKNEKLIVRPPMGERARELSRMHLRLESALGAVKAELSALNAAKMKEDKARHDEWAKEQAQGQGQTHPDLLREVCRLRDEYQAFAADGTRSPTMRRMASEFVVRLNPLIRASINRKSDPKS